MIIGAHTSFGSKQLLGCVQTAIMWNANTFMFYTGAPQNSYRLPINGTLTNEAKNLMLKSNIDINNVICHAPFIINLANPMLEEFNVEFLNKEIERCGLLGVKRLVLHPGTASKTSKEEGIKQIIKCLNRVLTQDMKIIILLETMAGKSNELGTTTEELKQIIDNIILKEKAGVCIDTCHLNDAGYSLEDFDSYLKDFDHLLGLEKLLCVHVNDSKNEFSAHKDRHANIGEGFIGLKTLAKIVHHPKLILVPKILETPEVDGVPIYKEEIELLRNTN